MMDCFPLELEVKAKINSALNHFPLPRIPHDSNKKVTMAYSAYSALLLGIDYDAQRNPVGVNTTLAKIHCKWDMLL